MEHRNPRKTKQAVAAAAFCLALALLFYAVFPAAVVGLRLYRLPLAGAASYHEAYLAATQILWHDERAAHVTLESIMARVKNQPEALEALSDAEYIELGELVCLLVAAQGGVKTREEHYFRNVFSRAPPTLEEMVASIQHGGDIFGWRLMPPASTYLHMLGPEGEFNLKFVSENGYFEAVYDKTGALLTAQTNPLNMGTFNYASPLTQGKAHYQYDVQTYYQWNNTPGQGPVEDGILEKMREKYEGNSAAREYHETYENTLSFSFL